MAPKYNRKKPAQYKPKPKKGNSKKNLLIAIGIIAVVLTIAGVYFAGGFGTSDPSTSPTPTVSPTATPNPTPATNETQVLLQTNMGNITLQLYDYKPITTQNFLKLVALGEYDGTVFHRIMDGFMIQGGTVSSDVQEINDEIGSYNRNLPYTIAMAKTINPNSATSQFFINLVDNGPKVIDTDGTTFDQTYTAFGEVIEGQSVVDNIANISVTENPYNPGEYSVPTQTVTIISATIIS